MVNQYYHSRILPTKVASLLVGREEIQFARMRFTKDLKELNNKIIECTFKDGQWVFLRERTDKTYPNSFNTAKGKRSISKCNTKLTLFNSSSGLGEYPEPCKN